MNQNLKPTEKMYVLILTLFVFACANSTIFYSSYKTPILLPVFAAVFLFSNLFSGAVRRHLPSLRLKICFHGLMCLRVFILSSIFSIIFNLVLVFILLPHDWGLWLINLGVCILAENIIFFNGIISVYCTSVQLGLKLRVIGLICGLIPIANFIVLLKIIKVVKAEVDFETAKAEVNKKRKDEEICKTKYPLLLVHGVFFRDFRFPNYWGRIPGELIKNGAVIYYGNHQSASSIEESARELSQRIKEIVQKSGCKKVNIIAHSKGGLDCRYALKQCGISENVASLTTINTPHHGCIFADYLLGRVPVSTQKHIEAAYNSSMKRLGDSEPDFMAAVKDLTSSRVFELEPKLYEAGSGVYCQSIGSRLNKATHGKFPLNFTYPLVKYFDGANDGLVSESSMSWGERFIFLTTNGKRGISHGDMVDLNRENIDGFDVREFYVQLAADLKQRGL